MKQIPFTLEAFGPDGQLKERYEVRCFNSKADFIKKYGDFLKIVFDNGTCWHVNLSENFAKEYALTLYRRTRTPEEVAKLTWNRDLPEFDNSWDALRDDYKKFYINLVQAGMDEMKND